MSEEWSTRPIRIDLWNPGTEFGAGDITPGSAPSWGAQHARGAAVEWFDSHLNEQRDRVADLVEIARFDLPKVAAYGVVAMQVDDDDISRTMLHRVFAEAIDA